jgi:hypothetical protein
LLPCVLKGARANTVLQMPIPVERPVPGG